MARTFRRKQHCYEYRWVLRDWDSTQSFGHWIRLDPHSKSGRKALAFFHSDKQKTISGAAPRWYRKVFDHRIRTANHRALRRYLADPDYDPVFQDWHKHSANWSWW